MGGQRRLRQIQPLADVADCQVADASFRHQIQCDIHDLVLPWRQFMLYLLCPFMVIFTNVS